MPWVECYELSLVVIVCPIIVEPGLEMMVQLNMLTGMTFTSPTGLVGNYNHGELGRLFSLSFISFLYLLFPS